MRTTSRTSKIIGPGWLDGTDDTTRFAIDATMPPSTTKEQLRVMLQNLLAERFKFAFHLETREHPKYSLVAGKNGPKMKESAGSTASQDDPPLPPGGRSTRTIDPYGFPV